MVVREMDHVWITGLMGITTENGSLAETTTITMNKLKGGHSKIIKQSSWPVPKVQMRFSVLW